jgi:O-antigen/teichoic acid export membrane protein
MTLLKNSAYLVVATGIKAIAGVAILKLIAEATGVAVFGQLSQLLGVIALVSMLAAGAIGQGLTRELATSTPDDARHWLVAAARIAAGVSVAIGVCSCLLAWPASTWLWGDTDYVPVLLGLGVAQTAIGVASLAQAVAVTRDKHAFVLQFVTLGAVLGVAAVAISLSLDSGQGAAWGVLLNAIAPGVVVIALRARSVIHLVVSIDWMRVDDWSRIQSLLRYAAVPLSGALSLGLSQLLMRQWVADSVGWESVGYWQAVTRLSDLYLQFVSVVLVGVALPRWAKAKGYATSVIPMLSIGGLLLGVTAIICVVMVTFSETLLTVLYAKSFLPAQALLPWQVAGDLARVIAVCLSTGLLARGETNWPIAYEVVQGVMALAVTALLLPLRGGEAPVIAYAFTYASLVVLLGAVWGRRCSQERP